METIIFGQSRTVIANKGIIFVDSNGVIRVLDPMLKYMLTL